MATVIRRRLSPGSEAASSDHPEHSLPAASTARRTEAILQLQRSPAAARLITSRRLQARHRRHRSRHYHREGCQNGLH